MRVLFIIRKNSYLYCRLTINKSRCTPFSTGIKVEANKWDAKNQKILKNKLFNEALDKIRTSLQKLHYDNPTFGVEELKNLFLGKEKKIVEEKKDYLTLFLEKEKEKLDNNLINASSYKYLVRYFTLFQDFCKHLKINYLELNKLQVEQFYNWLLAQKYENGYIKVIFVAIKRLYALLDDMDVITKNPFRNYRFPSFQRSKHFLTADSLTKIFEQNTPVARLYKIQIMTGLAYVDTLRFEHTWIVEKDGDYYLKYIRSKTLKKKPKFCIAPITPDAYKYITEGVPKIAYQTYIKALRKLFEELGISEKPLTHTARKMYGQMLLKQGYTAAEVSRFMGHSDLEVTAEHYLENEIYFTLKR